MSVNGCITDYYSNMLNVISAPDGYIFNCLQRKEFRSTLNIGGK
jgi:hypothetical protein